MLEISALLALSLLGTVPIIKKIQKEKSIKHQERLELSAYLLGIQKEIEELPTDVYLQKSWLYENFIDEITEIIQNDKAILRYLDRELAPDIFEIYENKKHWLKYINYEFFEDELKNYENYFNNIESNPLTPMQRMAIITHEENNLILAGAGSGKTSVILAKVGYILKKGYALEDEILVLAFNKKAQQELEERLKNRLNKNITIKTFHAFGNSISLESETLVPNKTRLTSFASSLVKQSSEKESQNFDEMITKATQAIETEQYISPYRYLFIDEFQDISEDRNRLILALKKQNDANITVVGDDWQSINKFAGSNIDIIQNFEAYYGSTATIKLDYTFRFNQEISEASQNFILKNPAQIHKNIKSRKKSKNQSFYLYWYTSSKNMDKYIEQIIKLIKKKTNNDFSKKFYKKSIMILSRYSFNEPKNLKYLQDTFSETLDISFSTIHGAKGLEADYVIITHLENGKFGFPSEQSKEADEFLYAEERRLFYVALTRAKEKIFFIAHSKQTSSFIDELKEENNIYALN